MASDHMRKSRLGFILHSKKEGAARAGPADVEKNLEGGVSCGN